MIVQLRGTSGSGKSTVVRNIMALKKDWIRVKVEGRKQPIGYLSVAEPALAVMGHYETACGGCDTIPSMDRIYDLIREAADKGFNVLYEGLLISAEVNRAVELGKTHDFLVLGIELPLELCLASINERRRAKKPDAPDVNPKNTEAKWKQTQRSMVRLAESGVECRWGSREEVERMARVALGL